MLVKEEGAHQSERKQEEVGRSYCGGGGGGGGGWGGGYF